jgi:hypothetical protein
MLDNMPSNYTKKSEQVFTNQGRSPWGHVLAGCLELTSEGTFFAAKDLAQAHFAVNALQQNMVFPKTVAQIYIINAKHVFCIENGRNRMVYVWHYMCSVA